MPRYLHAIFLAFLLMLNITPASAYVPQGLSMFEQKIDYQADFSGRPLVATDAGLQYFGDNDRDPKSINGMNICYLFNGCLRNKYAGYSHIY